MMLQSQIETLCSRYAREGLGVFNTYFHQFDGDSFGWRYIEETTKSLIGLCPLAIHDFFAVLISTIPYADSLHCGQEMVKELRKTEPLPALRLAHEVAEATQRSTTEANEWQRAEALVRLADQVWDDSPKLAFDWARKAVIWAQKSQNTGDIDGSSVLSEICERLARRGEKEFALQIAATIDLESRRERTVKNITNDTCRAWE